MIPPEGARRSAFEPLAEVLGAGVLSQFEFHHENSADDRPPPLNSDQVWSAGKLLWSNTTYRVMLRLRNRSRLDPATHSLLMRDLEAAHNLSTTYKLCPEPMRFQLPAVTLCLKARITALAGDLPTASLIADSVTILLKHQPLVSLSSPFLASVWQRPFLVGRTDALHSRSFGSGTSIAASATRQWRSTTGH